MKRIIALFVLALAFQVFHVQASDKLPDDFVKEFMSNCTNELKQNGKSEKYADSYCNCALKTMEENYTAEDFSKLDEDRKAGKDITKDQKFQEVLKRMEECKKNTPE